MVIKPVTKNKTNTKKHSKEEAYQIFLQSLLGNLALQYLEHPQSPKKWKEMRNFKIRELLLWIASMTTNILKISTPQQEIFKLYQFAPTIYHQ